MREQLRPQCLPFETIAAFHEGRVSSAESGAIQSHLASCAVCRAELASLSAFEQAAVEPNERNDVDAVAAHLRRTFSPRPQGGAWRKWLALPVLPKLAVGLATVAILAAVTLQWQSRRLRGLDGFTPSGEIRSSAAIHVSPQGDLMALPISLSWSPVPRAVAYELSLKEVDGTEIWRTSSRQPSLTLNQTLGAFFLPLKTLTFHVRAVDAGGALLAESEAVRLRLTPATRPQESPE